jgi:hypothetical protein
MNLFSSKIMLRLKVYVQSALGASRSRTLRVNAINHLVPMFNIT